MKFIPIFFILFFSLSLNASANEMLPVSAFASLPDVRGMELSPNGKMVASLVNLQTEELTGTAVSLYNVETDEAKYPMYADNEKFVLNWVRWANDKKLLISARYPAVRYGVPTTETRLTILDIETMESENLIRSSYLGRMDRIPQFQDRIVDMLIDDEEHIVVALASSSPYISELYKLNLDTRRWNKLSRTSGKGRDWVTDRQNNLRIGIEQDDTEYKIIHRPIDDRKWQTLWEFEAFSLDQVWPIGFDEDPNFLYIKAYHEDKLAVFKVDLSNPSLARELVFHDPDYDVNGSLVYSKLNNAVVGITYSSEGGFSFWDEEYTALQNGLNKVLPDTENIIIGLSDDERRYLVSSTSDTDSGTFFYGDRDQKTLVPIAYKYSQLDESVMVEKNYVSYKARDGLEISGHLSLPLSAGEEALPTVVFPHGGPISYDDGGFDYWTQFFANRGYAVLQMNFRGSSGYGYSFMQSGLKNWGLDMQNDVEDGTRWLISEGIADPERICVVGASYGGYAALMEAARNSDLYQCAVSFAGVTDIPYLVRSSRRYTNYEVVKEQIGSDYRDLKTRSPVNLAEQIDIPVLLVHGTKDRSVRFDHSRRMNSALNKEDKDVLFIRQEDGDHYLSNETYRLELFDAMDGFLEEHLGTQADKVE